jgi:Coenzyme PQQ synthesis protein D (PqqD)
VGEFIKLIKVKSYFYIGFIGHLIPLIYKQFGKMNLRSVPSRSSSVVTRKTGNEYVLVPVTDNIADMNSVYTLNETGAFIWEQIDGNRTISDIIALLTTEFDTDNDTAAADLLDFLSKMNDYLIIK